MTKRHGFPAAAAVLLGVGISFGASAPVAGQTSASGGANTYAGDEFCLNSTAALTVLELNHSGGVAGASATVMNEDAPWLRRPGSGNGPGGTAASATLLPAQQEDAYLTQGLAFQLTGELLPIGILRRVLALPEDGGFARIERILRPYAGAGLIIITEGETREAGDGRDLPTYAMQRVTAPVLTYGARLFLSLPDRPIGLVVQYRGTSAFVRDGKYERPDGTTENVGDSTLSWGTFTVGLTLGVGG